MLETGLTGCRSKSNNLQVKRWFSGGTRACIWRPLPGGHDLHGAREVDRPAVARLHAHRVQPILAIHQLHDAPRRVPDLCKHTPPVTTGHSTQPSRAPNRKCQCMAKWCACTHISLGTVGPSLHANRCSGWARSRDGHDPGTAIAHASDC